MSRAITLLREAYPARPALDTAISRALLNMASDGRQPETLRLYRPGSIVAFGPQDVSSKGFQNAVWAARAGGFEAVQRLAGGRAAVFHPRTIAFSWTIPAPDPRQGIKARFQALAEIMQDAFKALGVDAHIGQVPWEYCPGQFSVNARGATKLMGVGQRLEQHAAHVGGVVVVGESARVSGVLVPVYHALGLEWDPATTGSLEDELGPLRYEDVERAILDQFSAQADIVEAPLPREVLDLAFTIEREHSVA